MEILGIKVGCDGTQEDKLFPQSTMKTLVILEMLPDNLNIHIKILCS